jgi:outer membrane receptor protein involved in Fe transport
MILETGKRKFFVLTGFIVMVLFLLAPAVAGAQTEEESVTKLDKMVVTADRTATKLLDTPSNIAIITREDIEMSGQKDIAGVISSLPGVINDTSGTVTYFNLRGTRSTSSGGPLIYVDGIPMNQGESNYSLIDNISLDAVQQIEVIKSPPASLYGSNAARGVINIVTKRGSDLEKPLSGSAGVEWGSWATFNQKASLLGKTGRVDYSLFARNEDTDGYRDTDEELTTLDGNFGFQITDTMKATLIGNYSDSSRAFAPELFAWCLDEYRERPYRPDSEEDPTYLVGTNEHDKEIYSTALEYTWDLDQWQLRSFFSYRNLEEEYRKLEDYNEPGGRDGIYYEDREDDNYRFKLSGNGTLFDDGRLLTDKISGGYEFNGAYYEQERRYPFAETLSSYQQRSLKSNDLDYERTINSFFVTNEFIYGNFDLTAGLRFDTVDYDLQNESDLDFSADFDEVGWNIAPAYHFTQNSTVYFSVGESYWYPVTSYFTYAVNYGDEQNRPEDLKPEEYLNYEIGYKHRFCQAFNLNLNVFYMEVEGKYMPFYDEDADWKGYKSVGDSIHQGFEIEADGKPFDFLAYELGFSYLEAEWDEADGKVEDPADGESKRMDLSDKDLVRIPEYELLARLVFFITDDLRLTTDLKGIGSYYIDQLNRWDRESVYTFDAKLQYQLELWGRTADIYLSGANIFDKEYESIFNSSGTTNPDGTPDNNYYPLDGQYFETGLTLNF